MNRALTRSFNKVRANKARAGVLALLTATGLALTACGSDEGKSASTVNEASSEVASEEKTEEKKVTIEDNTGEKGINTPPQRVVVTDNRSFEILSDWGITPVAAPLTLVKPGVTDWDTSSIIDLGSHKEPQLEGLVEANPDLIISGQRFTRYDEQMQELAPDATLIDLEPREGESLTEEFKRHTRALGKIFDKENEAEELIKNYDEALERAKKAYDSDSSVMAVNVSGGEIGYIAPSIGRTYGPIFDLLELKPALEVENASSNHEGDDVSVEAIAESNPDWIFVLDRDGAMSADQADYKPAAEVIEGSEALKNVTAVKDGRVVVAPQDTYQNENIITYTEILNAIADAFEQAK